MSASTTQPTNTTNTVGVPPTPPEPHQQAIKGGQGIALRVVEGESETQYIALGALRLDERNVRKDQPTESEIALLADLIDAQGLLQNLTVIAYAQPVMGKGKGKGKGRAYTHGVIAGGRRLRALLELVKRGRLTLDEEILCAVVPEGRALAVSAAENSGRAAMSAADTIVAFADMVKAGAGVEDLALCFGLSPLTVQRRLKLANVSPKLFALFRAEGMTLDQLMALALTEDHAAQETAWAAAPDYDRSPSRLRALIAGKGLSSSIIRFVGIDAYEAAGGGVLRDLFAEADDQPAYIQDPALMLRLALEKLEGLAQGVREQGAAWVEVFTALGYTEREQFTTAPTSKRAPTDAEAAELAALAVQADRLYEQIEAAYDADDEDHDQELIDRLESEAEAVAERKGLLDAGMRVLLPQVAGLAGAVVSLDSQGNPKIERNLLRKADAANVKRTLAKAEAAASNQGDTDDEQGTAPNDAAQAPKAGLSDRLCHQLTAHRTRALQALLLGNQCAALAALAHPLLTRLVYGPGSSYVSPSAIKVSAENCEAQLASCAPDLGASRAERVMQDALAQARELLPADETELLPWLLAQPLEALQQLLSLCAALSLNAINGTGKQHASTAALAGALGLDMADWWEATQEGYLGAVSKAQIAQAVSEAGLADAAQELGKLKKAEAAAQAQALLLGKRWLPAVLR